MFVKSCIITCVDDPGPHWLPPVDRRFHCGDVLDDTALGDLCWHCEEAMCCDTDWAFE